MHSIIKQYNTKAHHGKWDDLLFNLGNSRKKSAYLINKKMPTEKFTFNLNKALTFIQDCHKYLSSKKSPNNMRI